MKAITLPVIVGIALVLVGAYVFVEGGYVSTRREVIDVGGLKISAEERHPIKPWVAGIALVAGTALIASVLVRNKS
jgi:hypothetical protein